MHIYIYIYTSTCVLLAFSLLLVVCLFVWLAVVCLPFTEQHALYKVVLRLLSWLYCSLCCSAACRPRRHRQQGPSGPPQALAPQAAQNLGVRKRLPLQASAVPRAMGGRRVRTLSHCHMWTRCRDLHQHSQKASQRGALGLNGVLDVFKAVTKRLRW